MPVITNAILLVLIHFFPFAGYGSTSSSVVLSANSMTGICIRRTWYRCAGSGAGIVSLCPWQSCGEHILHEGFIRDARELQLARRNQLHIRGDPHALDAAPQRVGPGGADAGWIEQVLDFPW